MAAAGLQVLAGWCFDAGDQAGAPPVAMVNERAAQSFWPGESAVGQCLFTFQAQRCFEVIGVVENTRGSVLQEGSGREWFLPLTQLQQEAPTPNAILGMGVRTANPARTAPGLTQFIRTSSPDLPYVHVRPFWEVLDSRTRSWRLGATMFSFFVAAALALAAVGVFGLVAFSVRQRRPEIAIRMAVGAGPRQIFRRMRLPRPELSDVRWLLSDVK